MKNFLLRSFMLAVSGMQRAFRPVAKPVYASPVLHLVFFLGLLGVSQHTQAQTTLAGFDVNGLTNGGPATLAASTVAANVTAGALTKSAGVTSNGANDAFGGTGWSRSTDPTSITGNANVTFTVKANSGYVLSLSAINPLSYRRSPTGPASGLIQYQIDGGSFINIGAPVSFTNSTNGGATLPPIDLSSIPGLQNLLPTITVTFRIIPYGGSGATGTWYINNITGQDLAVTGTVACPSITATLTGTSTICSGTSTTLAATIAGGTSPYTVRVTDGTNASTVTGYISGSAIDIMPTTSKTYTIVLVRDANNCTATVSGTATVTVETITAAITNLAGEYCKNAPPVTLTGTPTGAGFTGVFTINGATATTFDPATLTAGQSYTVVYSVTNTTGCSSTASQTVRVRALPNPNITGLANNYCKDAAPVSLTGNPSGGAFTIDGVAATSFDPATLATGQSYTVVYSVTNVNGCSASTSETFRVRPLPTATLTSSNSLNCAVTSTTLTAGAGTGYSYAFSGPGLISSDPVSGTAVANLGGTYSVTVTSGFGCTAVNTTTVISDVASPTATITGTLTVCAGLSTALNASGGTSYTWSTGETTPLVSVTAGTYSVAVTAVNGCTALASATVTPVANPTATIGGTLTVITGGSTTLTASGGTSYTWSTGETTAAVSVTAGTYSVTVANASGCVSSTTATVIEVNTAPVATTNNNQTATVGLAFSYTVNAFADAETPSSLTYSASISPANNFTFDPAMRVISGTPSLTGVSSVTVTASDFGGLSASTTFTITVSPPTCGTLTVPGDYQTIQSAINAACPGAVIQVAAGTYTEQLTISKNLSILGVGVGPTIVQAPGSLAAGNLNASHRNIIEINNSAAVTITGINVNGPVASGGCGELVYGININGGAGLNLSNASVTNIYQTPTSLFGCQSGFGIRAGFGLLNSPGSLTATNVTVTNYQKGGIIIDGIGSNGIITNATVTGVGATTAIAQNGIQISRGATGNVQSSTVTGNSYTDINNTDTQAAGLLAFENGTITASGNSFTGNNIGLYAGGPGLLTANNNSFSNNDYASTYAAAPATFTGSGNTFDKQITNNNKVGTVYSAIQVAVNDATAGDVISVGAGTFVENVTIPKSLTLLGANSGINPNTGLRVAETIVLPATTGATDAVYPASIVTVFSLTGSANNVVIDGFTLDGANPAISDPVKSVTLNGVEVDAAAGISGSGAGVTGGTVRNNIVKNFAYDGVDFSGDGTPTFNTIANNSFDNIAYTSTATAAGLAVLISDNGYASITGNTATKVRAGVQTNTFNQPSPGGVPTISGNTFTAYRYGVFHNLHQQSATGFVISNNTITGGTGLSGTAPLAGIALSSIQSTVPVTVAGNTVNSGFPYGVESWNTPTTGNVILSGGTVQGSVAGVRITTRNRFGDATSSKLLVSGVTIADSPVGILSFHDPASANGITASVTVTDNTQITGTGAFTAVAISGADASANITGNASSFVGNGAGTGVDVNGGTASVNANRITSFATGISVSNGGQLTGVANNFITGNTDGITYAADAGTTQGIVLTNNLSGNTNKAIINSLTSTTINANCNWFGGASATINPTYVTGNVSTTQVLANGTDEDIATAGFQNTSCFTPPTAPVLTLSPAPQLGPNTSYCIGENPTVTSNYTTGTNSFTVQARSDGSTTVTTGNSVTISQGAGAYDIFATNSQNGYTSPVSTTFVQIAPVVTNFVSDKAAYCVGETVSLTALGCNVTASSPNLYRTLLRSLDGSNNENQGTAFLPDGVTSYTYSQFTTTTPTTYTVTAECVNTGTGQVCGRTQLVITANPLPVATLSSSNTLTCAAPTATLTAGGGATYLFAGPGAITQNGSATAVVNVAGTYSVTVISAAGCISTTVTTVSSDTATPTASLMASNSLNCAVTSATLTAGGGLSYAFSGPGLTTSDPNAGTAVASAGGTYSVVVTAANGCTALATTSVLSDTAAPSASLVASGTLTCANPVVTLTANARTKSGTDTYTFSTGATPLGGNTATVTSGGIYSVTVTSTNGCTNTASVTVISDQTTPTATLLPASTTLTCTTPSVSLTATGGMTYAFSGGTPITANTISVTAAGTYSVTVTAANGCTSVTSATIAADQTPPTASLTPTSATLTCTTPSVTLTASGGTTYAFSGGTPLTANTISVTAAGTYSVTVTAANGCTGVTSATIAADQTPPAASLVASGTLTCANPVVTLTANANTKSGTDTYTFSTGATPLGGNTATVSSGGIYSVTVTSTNGCTNTASVTVISDQTTPTATLLPASTTLTCTTPSVSLTATGGMTYAFSGGTPITANTISVTAAGTYSVTVTAANGCTSVTSATIAADQTPPTASLTPTSATLTCTTPSITLTASGGTGYAFSGGASAGPNAISVTTAGTYSVTVTAANGCTSVTSATIASDQTPPTPTIAGTLTVCAGLSTTLTASGGTSYKWSTGAVTASVSVTAGTYSVTVTASNGCTAVASATVTPVANPTAVITNLARNYCRDAAPVTLTGTPTGNGFTGVFTIDGVASGTLMPSSLTVGQHTVVYSVTSTVTGCSSTTSESVRILPVPMPDIVGLANNFCKNEAPVSLTGTPSGGNFTGVFTIDGVTAQVLNPADLTIGQHTVVYSVTNAAGCSATTSQTVTIRRIPTPEIDGLANNFCMNATPVSLTGTPAGGFFTVDGVASATLTPSSLSVGQHTVVYTVTNANSCSASTSQTITIRQVPMPTLVSTTLTCAATSATLTATVSNTTGNFTYAFGNGATQTSPNTATVNTAGVYSVTVTTASGCSNIASTTVISDVSTPTATLSVSNSLNCAVSSATLSASGGVSYAFSGPGLTQTGTGNTAVVNAGGTYSVTVTAASGCSAIATVNVISDVTSPTATLSVSNSLNCAVASATLTATGGVSYAFRGPGLSGVSSNTALATTAGTYSVTVTAVNGCSAVANVTVVSDVTSATASLMVSNSLNCAVSSATLTAAGGATYAFSGPGLSGVSSNTALATTAGTYSVTVTAANGCSAIATTTVISDVASPTATLTVSNSLNCAVSSATLTATGGVSYAFSGPGLSQTGAGNTATVNTAGLYSVTVTAASGCTAIATATVISSTGIVSLTLTSSNGLSCGLTSATLTANLDPTGARTTYAYAFSPGATQIGSSNQATVTTAGPYSVTVTAANGCTALATTSVTSDTAVPTVNLTANGPLTCAQTSVTLTANTGTRSDTYAFAGPSGSILSTRNTAVVSSAGTYTVTATSTNGCSSTAITTVISDTAVPGLILASSNGLSCAVTSATLTASIDTRSGTYTYAFSNGATQIGSSNQATVTTAGSYSVTVTAANGCTVTAATSVTADVSTPTATLSVSNSLNCAVSSATLSASGGVSYAFSGPGLTQTGTGNTAVVNAGGTYSVTVTAASGCSAIATVNVISDVTSPTATLMVSNSLNCGVTSATLTASGGTTYAFSGPGLSGVSSNTALATTAGMYSVTVTAANGCSAVANVTVISDVTGATASLMVSNSLNCGVTSATLTAAGGATYAFSGPGLSGVSSNTALATTAGTYSVTVTAVNGCSAVANVTVISDVASPTATLAVSNSLNCGVTSATLTASGGGTYAFSAGATQVSPATATVNAAGTFSVTVTAANGCSAVANVTVISDVTSATASLTVSNSLNCGVTSATLTATGGVSYAFSGGTVTGNTAVVNAGGTYSVTVTAASGCSAIATATVISNNAVPTPTITGLASSFCKNAGPVTLTGSPVGGSFAIDGATTTTLDPASLMAGQHTVTYSFTNANQCSATVSQIVVINQVPQSPVIQTQGGQSNVTVSQNTGDVVLFVSGCSGGTIAWSGGAANSLTVSTATTGVFTYTATCQANGCTSPIAVATVTVGSTSLRVLHRDASNGNLNTNAIYPYLMLDNLGTTPIPYSELTVRYWLTVENPTPVTNLPVYNASFGAGNVQPVFVPLNPARTGATGYVEYRFTPGAGSLAGGTNSGSIDNAISKQDYSAFNQADDYSYVLNRDFTPNAHITAYRNGVLIWGTEPAGTPGVVTPLTLTASANPTTILTTGSTTLSASVSGGTPGYSYTFSGPGTFTPNGSTASVSGIPAGVQTFTVFVSDATTPVSQTISTTVSVTVNTPTPANTPPTTTVNANQTATVGVAFSYTANAFTDAETPNNLTYGASINPANGLTYNPVTRVLAGTPTGVGVSSVTLTASDPGGLSTSTIFTVTVSAAPVAGTASLRVLHRDASNGQLNTNAIYPYFSLDNLGTQPLDYSRITVRYWLTVENPAPVTNLPVYGADFGAANVLPVFVPLSPARQNATGYVEYSFKPAAGSLAGGANSGGINTAISKQDYSAFDQANDYSYMSNRDFTPNNHFTAYYDGTLVWGTEPSVSARLAAAEVDEPLRVEVMGNPVQGGEVAVKVTGAANQPLRLRVTDLNGHLVGERTVERAGLVEQQRLSIGQQAAGLLLIQVSTPKQTQTVKVLKVD